MNPINRRAFTGMTLAAASAGRALAAAPDRVIPLQLDHNHLGVQVMLDGKGPYPFAMSTGQLMVVVSLALAQAVGLRRQAAQPRGAQTARGVIPASFLKARSLLLGGVWELKEPDLLGVKFSTDAAVQGAFPFISGAMSSFDFEVPEMRFHQTRVEPLAGAAKVALMQRSGGSRPVREPPLVNVDLNGRRLRLLVSTGETDAIILAPDAVRRLDLWDSQPRSFTRQVSDSDGSHYQVRTARADNVVFAGQSFSRLPLRLMSPTLAKADMVDWDGVVGMDLLRRFRILFDPARASAWFSPNRHLAEDYRYDRAGLDTEDEGDGVRVTQVDPASPAERAGVRLDDLIVGVVGRNDRPNLHWLLCGRPGETVGLQIERAGERKDVRIVLEERI